MSNKPVAWRTFDGEGGYDYRSYEDNEEYAKEWEQRNPKHKGWVEPLYTGPRPWVGLTDDEVKGFNEQYWDDDNMSMHSLIKAIEAKLRERNT